MKRKRPRKPRLKPVPAGDRVEVRVSLLLTAEEREKLYQLAAAFPPSRGGRPPISQAATMVLEEGLAVLRARYS